MDYLKMRVQQLAKLRLQNLFIIFPVGRDYYGFPAELRQMLRPQASPMYGCQVTGRKVPSDNCESLQPECPYKSESVLPDQPLEPGRVHLAHVGS
jgi:hypothetical protein